MPDVGAVVVAAGATAGGAAGAVAVWSRVADYLRQHAAIARQADDARHLLGLHETKTTTYRHDSVHPYFPSGADPHPDNKRALAAAAGKDYVDAKAANAITELDSAPAAELTKNLVLIGSPTAEGLSRIVFGYSDVQGDRDSLKLTDSPLELPFRFILNKEEISSRARAKRYVPGHGWVSRPNWRIERDRGDGGVFIPEVGEDDLLVADFLLVTRLPNILSQEAEDSGHAIVSVAGTHGTGTRAVELLYGDAKALAALARGLGEHASEASRGFQMLYRVSGMSHSKRVGTHATRIDPVGEPVLLPAREPVWREARRVVRDNMRRWSDQGPEVQAARVPMIVSTRKASVSKATQKVLKFAPRDVFETALEYFPMPTFDLVIRLPSGGVLLVRRRLPPYANTWALPGLRMCKPEGLSDTLRRIARVEARLEIDAEHRIFLGQYVGKFRTERGRQDISTGYLVKADSDAYKLNADHFTEGRVIREQGEIPNKTGAMYRFYLDAYFQRSSDIDLPMS